MHVRGNEEWLEFVESDDKRLLVHRSHLFSVCYQGAFTELVYGPNSQHSVSFDDMHGRFYTRLRQHLFPAEKEGS